MSELTKRKKLLVAECEVYRQVLKMEIQTFRIYGIRTARRWKSIKTYVPMVMASLPMVGTVFGGKRRSPLRRWISLAFLGWKAYRQMGPFLRAASEAERKGRTAAEEYLEKRM